MLHVSIDNFDGTAMVARLVGSAWLQIGASFDIVPEGLASVGGSLYAFGNFTTIGGAAINRVARFDGAAWQPLGTGADGPVNGLAGLNGAIIAGGSFTSVGGRGYASFAVYGCAPAACAADFNHSGSVTVQDIFDFLAAYFAGTAGADFNSSGTITVQDIFDFLAAYFTGCV